jgi:predicted ATPase
MLTSLELNNFTVFGNANIEFAPGLNVIVGENGTGKSHILKLAYSLIYVTSSGNRESATIATNQSYLDVAIASKLISVFRPDDVGRLARRNRRGRQGCKVACNYKNPKHNLSFTFNTASKLQVAINKPPVDWLTKLPVYLPTRELLTIYPGFVSLYETTHLAYEETWRDTCVLLGAPLARGPREKRIKELLEPLENAMEGKVEVDSAGRFYLTTAGLNKMEMHLVAEGLRKLAMVARLIATGSLVDKGYLFWDEPESNLNPKLIKLMARIILYICQSGIQVFIASHSLFLIREVDILLQTPEFRGTAARFIGLHRRVDGVEARQGGTVDDIGPIDALKEELSQSDRYLDLEA